MCDIDSLEPEILVYCFIPTLLMVLQKNYCIISIVEAHDIIIIIIIIIINIIIIILALRQFSVDAVEM